MKYIGWIFSSVLVGVIYSALEPFPHGKGQWKDMQLSAANVFSSRVADQPILEKNTGSFVVLLLNKWGAKQNLLVGRDDLVNPVRGYLPQAMLRKVKLREWLLYSTEGLDGLSQPVSTLWKADLFFVMQKVAQSLFFDASADSVKRENSTPLPGTSSVPISSTSSRTGQESAELTNRSQFTNQLIVKYRRESSAFGAAQSQEQILRLGVNVGIRLNYLRAMSGDAHVLSLPSELPLAEETDVQGHTSATRGGICRA